MYTYATGIKKHIHTHTHKNQTKEKEEEEEEELRRDVRCDAAVSKEVTILLFTFCKQTTMDATTTSRCFPCESLAYIYHHGASIQLPAATATFSNSAVGCVGCDGRALKFSSSSSFSRLVPAILGSRTGKKDPLRKLWHRGRFYGCGRVSSFNSNICVVIGDSGFPTNSGLRPCFNDVGRIPILCKGLKIAAAVSEKVEEVVLYVEDAPKVAGGVKEKDSKRRKGIPTGASGVSSGVRLEHVSKTFKNAPVLKDVNWEVKKGERVGLVGINGAGKTTQLKIITGEEEPDSGSVVKVKDNMKIIYLTQEFEVLPSRTLREELMSAFKEQMLISEKIDNVQRALEMATDNMDLMARLLDELDGLQRQAVDVNLYDIDVKINKIMPEMGFSPDDGDRLVASFSGGWQMRISLGKILLQEPDLLLLDEPTNHLDLDTIEWLESYLKKQEVPMVIVSHDRAFLDQLCTKIVETDMGSSRTFEGNYSDYVLAKAAWIENQSTAWDKQQKEIGRTKDLIHRLSGGANTGRASSAAKQLEAREKELVEKPFEHKQLKFRFPECGRSGRLVVSLKNICFRYAEKVLFENADLLIERGEKIAIIGPNGCGKSTLLRLIMGYEKPSLGEVMLGEHRVVPNYFEQNQAEALDLQKTVLQTIEEAAEDWKLNDIKALLGRSNFKAEMMHRKVAYLSGGEKARLAFCKIMVTPSTLLVLDEPTNHLDIPSKEMLEEALREYSGTVILVSHDRYFLRQVVNRVVEVNNGCLRDYAGDYNYYLEKNLEARRKEIEREAELDANTSPVKAKSKMSKAEKEIQKKQKAQAFQQSKVKSKITKNAKRWN
ncbi:hypothetical protein O6H91_02G133200 [Diphasiastrum complanatum]|uniref:Uncharacterized protein n=2 Tax=Diphasiastrum complanatum TaxID=34168 RepID=A0ACC2EKU4_DIPCM|nr:hypothetical protein O6H91_02G133200 [Diphasiastrum complanatum]